MYLRLIVLGVFALTSTSVFSSVLQVHNNSSHPIQITSNKWSNLGIVAPHSQSNLMYFSPDNNYNTEIKFKLIDTFYNYGPIVTFGYTSSSSEDGNYDFNEMKESKRIYNRNNCYTNLTASLTQDSDNQNITLKYGFDKFNCQVHKPQCLSNEYETECRSIKP